MHIHFTLISYTELTSPTGRLCMLSALEQNGRSQCANEAKTSVKNEFPKSLSFPKLHLKMSTHTM